MLVILFKCFEWNPFNQFIKRCTFELWASQHKKEATSATITRPPILYDRPLEVASKMESFFVPKWSSDCVCNHVLCTRLDLSAPTWEEEVWWGLEVVPALLLSFFLYQQTHLRAGGLTCTVPWYGQDCHWPEVPTLSSLPHQGGIR